MASRWDTTGGIDRAWSEELRDKGGWKGQVANEAMRARATYDFSRQLAGDRIEMGVRADMAELVRRFKFQRMFLDIEAHIDPYPSIRILDEKGDFTDLDECRSLTEDERREILFWALDVARLMSMVSGRTVRVHVPD